MALLCVKDRNLAAKQERRVDEANMLLQVCFGDTGARTCSSIHDNSTVVIPLAPSAAADALVAHSW